MSGLGPHYAILSGQTRDNEILVLTFMITSYQHKWQQCALFVKYALFFVNSRLSCAEKNFHSCVFQCMLFWFIGKSYIWISQLPLFKILSRQYEKIMSFGEVHHLWIIFYITMFYYFQFLKHDRHQNLENNLWCHCLFITYLLQDNVAEDWGIHRMDD